MPLVRQCYTGHGTSTQGSRRGSRDAPAWPQHVQLIKLVTHSGKPILLSLQEAPAWQGREEIQP